MKNKTVKMVLAVVVLGVCCGAYAGVKTYVAHQDQKESEEDSEESTTVFTASTDNIKSLDFMVDDTETTFEKDDEKKLVTREEMIQRFYDAIFVKQYNGSNYNTVLGQYEFSKESKTFALSAASMMSQFAELS